MNNENVVKIYTDLNLAAENQSRVDYVPFSGSPLSVIVTCKLRFPSM